MKNLLVASFICALTFSITSCANSNPLAQEVKTKADKAVVTLQEKVKEGYDVSHIVPKMKKVKKLGKSGKLKEANSVLDDIFIDFSELESRSKQLNETELFVNDQVVNMQSFLVYNRWGESVFENYDFQPNDPAQGWDGTHRKELLNPAVFVYVAVVEFDNGDVVIYKGDVTLLR